MEKETLENIIFKYHLEGVTENAKWNISNNEINIPFIAPNKDLFGRIKTDFVNTDSEFVVYGTSRLIKLLKVTDTQIDVKLNTQHQKTTKMIISDSSYELEYVLADMMLAPSIPKEINEPVYEIEFDLNEVLANKFVKAKKSVETDKVFITPTQNQSLKFVIGESGEFNDKINFEHPAKYDVLGIKTLEFPVEYLKNIFINNKCDGKGYLSIEGVLKLQFEENNIKSEYFLIAK